MSADANPTPDDIPEGVAVFPEIPDELGVHPLLLGVLHAVVFLVGSDRSIVNPEAGDEAVQQISRYLQRLEGSALARVKEDMTALVLYARQAQWERGLIQALRTFLSDMGVTSEKET